MKLDIQNFSFKFTASSRDVLKNISFSAESGSYWCIAGPNGAGKSTFLKAISGLVSSAHSSGNILWSKDNHSRSVKDMDRIALAKAIAFVPGSIRPQFDIRVLDFIIQGRYAHSPGFARPSTIDHELALSALAEAGIESIAKASITEISAGELQLTLIARALCQQSDVLIFDEATANLDLNHQTKVFALFENLNKLGKTVFVVSHDLNLAAEFCTNFLWLRQGSVFAVGTAKDTINKKVLSDLYGESAALEVGQNPFTNRPKIFFT